MLVQMKKNISMNYGSSEVWPNTFGDAISINSNLNPITKFTSSSKSTEPKDILPLNISQMIMKTVPISMRTVLSYAMIQGIPLQIRWKANGNWGNNMIRISQWKETIV